VGVGRDAGRQIDGDHRHAESIHVGDDRLEQAGERSMKPGADDGVDDEVALRHFAEVQLPLLGVRDLDDGQPDAAEDLEIGAGVAAHLADGAEEKDNRFDAALRERPRHDEPVAAVVAPATNHADLARRQVFERGFHRRDCLPAGVLHEHNGRQANLVDRLPIGFPHLLSV
jgi:hypothetical protein